MSSFTGVSMVEGQNGDFCSTSTVDTNTNSGYHLLMINGYSHTKSVALVTQSINTGTFMVGGHRWYVEYYPNGKHSNCTDFISLYVSLLDEDNVDDEVVDAKFTFSFVDQVDKQMSMHFRGTKICSFTHDCSFGIDKFMRKDALERSSNLKGDCITIRCDIMVVCKDPQTKDATSSGTDVLLLSDIHRHFNNLLQTKMGADVTFEVNGERFTAHRCVLAARSKVFMAQFFGPMKETSTVIQIKDMESKVFRALLNFIYTDSFPEMDDDNINMEEDEKEVVEQEQVENEMWLQELFAAADRYDLQRLRLICERQLSENIGVSSVMSTLALAERHHCQELKEMCLRFIQIQSPLTLANNNGK